MDCSGLVSLVSLHSFSSLCIEKKRARYLLEIQGIAKSAQAFCQCSFLPQQETCQNDNSRSWSSQTKVLFFSQKRITFQRSSASIPSSILSASGITANTPFTSVLISILVHFRLCPSSSSPTSPNDQERSFLFISFGFCFWPAPSHWP